jgi:phage terminase large subunit GpA-like protein
LHKVFYGETDNLGGGAWEEMDKWKLETGLEFTRADGQKLHVLICGIDAGDAYEGKADTVYRYCEQWNGTFPIKGFFNLTANNKEKGDLPGGFKRYRAARIGGADGPFILEVNTAHYKSTLFSRLKIPREPGDQKYGFCGFPCDVADEFFQQLVGEEKKAGRLIPQNQIEG